MTTAASGNRGPGRPSTGGPKLKLMPGADPGQKQPPAAPSAVQIGGGTLDWDNQPDISAVGLAEWRRLAEQFRCDPERFLEGDRQGLVAYCTFWADFDAAARDIAENGLTVPGRSSADNGRGVKNPNVAAKREASQQLRLWARELGLTPNARTQMKTARQAAGEDDNNPF